MDSRSKIGAPIPDGAYVVKGYFDPLLAADARRLAACPRPLAVIVADPPEPLLPLEARQLLVAALACVDVVIDDPDAVFDQDWTQAQIEGREAFEQHIQNRSKM